MGSEFALDDEKTSARSLYTLGMVGFFQGLIQRLKLHLHHLEASWDLGKRPEVQLFFHAISDGGARISPLNSHRIKIQDEIVMLKPG